MKPDNIKRNIQKKIQIPAQCGTLEGQIYLGNDVQKNPIGVLICHPHPQFGGTMANNVVRSLYRHFKKKGFPSLRFNFRGVGSSSGSYSGGKGEMRDVMDAKNILIDTTGISQIVLIGYSFGAAVAGGILEDSGDVQSFVAVSYPFTFISDFIKKAHVPIPKLFVMGDKDDFTSLQAFHKNVNAMPDPKNKKIFAGVNHFWRNKESELVDYIWKWLARKLP